MNPAWLKSLPAKMPTAEELRRAKTSPLMDALKNLERWEQWKKAKDEYDEAFRPRRIPEPLPRPPYAPPPMRPPWYVPNYGRPYDTLMATRPNYSHERQVWKAS